MQPSISIVGLGWLGLPLAQELTGRGYSIKGSTTSIDKQTRLQVEGIDTYLLNLNPQPEGDLAALLNADILVVNVPPKAGKFGADFHPMQMCHLAEAVKQSAVKWVIYVSSTSVYPELSRVMTETDVQTPEQSAAPELVRAEQTWLNLQHNELKVTILRCGGLMGYERQAGKYVAGRTIDSGAVPVNYIHRDDAVGLICAVLEEQLTGVYNVVAPQHSSRAEVYRDSCHKHGYALPTFVEPAEPVSFKIINSAKLIKQTDYLFQYNSPLDFP